MLKLCSGLGGMGAKAQAKKFSFLLNVFLIFFRFSIANRSPFHVVTYKISSKYIGKCINKLQIYSLEFFM